MMKLLGLSLAAVAVATAQETAVQGHEALEFDLELLPTEALSKFGSFKAHAEFSLAAALEEVKHAEVLAASSSFRGLQQLSDDDKCKKCVDAGEKWIVDFTTKMFEKMCSSKPDCPFLKKMCEVYKKHPKVIQGFLFGKVHAHMTAFSYCAGKKECEMPKQIGLDTTSGDEFDMGMALETLGDLMDMEEQEADDENDDDDTYSASTLATLTWPGPPPPPKDCDCGSDKAPANLFDDLSADKPKPKPKPHCDCICKGCIHHMTKFVLGMTIEKVKHICHDTKSAKIKKMCDWAKTHKEETVGFLFAKVAPWKGAMGFCAGNGRCLPGPPHHHHHHHSTTKPPKDEEDVVVA